jgi:aspartate/methionine/tyrosine aminotransferase/chorismate mutase
MNKNLEDYRKEIANIDERILRLVKARLRRVEEIGRLKKQRQLPVIDLQVEADVISRSLKQAQKINLDENFTKTLIRMLITEAIEQQGETIQNRAAFLYDIFERVKELETQGKKIIRLDVGEPDLPSPIQVKHALRDTLYERKYVGYSSAKGLQKLREAIAEDLNQQYNASINGEQVLITHGGKFAIFSAVLSTVSPGDHVILPEPTWPVYENCVHLAHGRADVIHTRFEEAWNLNMQEVETAFKITPKLMILCSPNNPTGKIFSEKTLEELTQLATKHKTHLLVDEVYSAYVTPSFKSILQIADSNFIYVNSFSKKYGMTGWRVGYAVSDVKTIEKMRRLLQISVTCVSEFIQYAALEAVTMNQNPFDNFAKEMKQRIDCACRDLDELPFSYIKPDGGMYVFPKAEVKGFNSYKFAHQLLSEKQVSVAPGDAFGNYPEHFRISLGISNVNIRNGIIKIGDMMAKWQEK